MSYESKTIQQVIFEINGRKLYLPAIQRKFVWQKPQIEKLFDSLMKNYPIGTFLFWKIKKEAAANYVFYDFLQHYDQRNPYNSLHTGAFLQDQDDIIGVLDGQQRLSALYLALKGTYTSKRRYHRTNNHAAYEKTELYVNLFSLPYAVDHDNSIKLKEDESFDFRFLSESDLKNKTSTKIIKTNENDEAQETEEPAYWLKVGNVLEWLTDDFDSDYINNILITKFKSDCEKRQLSQHSQFFENPEKKRFIEKFLNVLYKQIVKERVINYFPIQKENLEDILEIFVRVNSGGIQLNKTDLLFSTIVATWRDGREKIEDFLKDINRDGKFNFSIEYLMRCCLVLTDGPVLYKVDSFKSENVQKIRDEWDHISNAIRRTVNILKSFGLSGAQLASNNATIIIAYYLYKGGDDDQRSKEGMFKYLAYALINNLYGSSQDQLISSLRKEFRREVIDTNGKIGYEGRFRKFEIDEILKIQLPGRKKLGVFEDEIDGLLETEKGRTSFLILSLLYPNLRYSHVSFHQDHIHPAAGFHEDKLKKLGLSEEEIKEWSDRKNRLPNLQLLEGTENKEKNDSSFLDWLNKNKKDDAQRNHFFESNFIPKNISLDFKDFISFFDERKKILRDKLVKMLDAKVRNDSTDAYEDDTYEDDTYEDDAYEDDTYEEDADENEDS